jgi:AcrR family transcriptional regulator
VAASPDSPPPAPRERAASTRSRLLEATYELLLEHGYHGTTVQAVARRAGLTTGAIYGKFENKQQLAAAAVLERAQNLGPAIPPAPVATDTASLAEVLAEHLAAPARPEHRLLTEVTGAVMRDDGTDSPFFTGTRTIEAIARAAVDDARARHLIDPAVPGDALATILVNLYIGAITTKAWNLPQPDLDDLRPVLAALGRALAPPPA